MNPVPSPSADPQIRVDATSVEAGWTFAMREGPGDAQLYRLRGDFSQGEFASLYRAIATDFGLRLPRPAPRPEPWPADLDITPLLTRNIHPHLLFGYGDPAVLRVEEEHGQAYVLVVTSNDAPHIFPILRSQDARHWAFAGCAFEAGSTPEWAVTGKGRADFWAPEIHRVGDQYWLCFTARRRDGGLAIGLATATRPTGPFVAADAPLLEGEVIDAHLFVDPEAGPCLVWKEDRNGLWPDLLLKALTRDPSVISSLFDDPARSTAGLYAALAPWIAGLKGMQRFTALHPLIETVTADLGNFTGRVVRLGQGSSPVAPLAGRIADALTTPILAQRVDPVRMVLAGERRTILRNDQPWEAHLVEGPWIHHREGTYYLFYAGNDFSTERYGIGCAVAIAPLGPYRKLDGPFLQSGRDWVGPGHPSVITDDDGHPCLFFHAYHPGTTGYGAFRALLRARLELAPDRVAIGRRL